jgi:hypothetical protein
MQMALEALESVTGNFTRTPSTLRDSEVRGEAHKAITVLRQALETEQKTAVSPGKGTGFNHFRASAITVLRQPQEPVGRHDPGPTAWRCQCGRAYTVTCISSKPPKREWVGLTDEEIAQGPQEVLPALYGRRGWAEKEAFEAVVAWAEAKLKEKNT